MILDRYRPLEQRGRGAFGNVEVAWDTRLQRRVAIKHIPLTIHAEKTALSQIDTPGAEESGGSAGIDEARTAALLSNPNIVAVYDFETTAHEALIIMENVDGPTLLELMAGSTELLELNTVTAILDGIVQALECAHENQVLHLDIKPANVLVDHSGHIKVSDFGLAELAGAAGFGEVQGGTIGYMPPEQIEMEPVDVRTDLWALAALAYQLLTGDNPFFGLSTAASLAHIVDEPLVLPSALRDELDEGVDAALIKALDGDITQRQATVAEFWSALQPYLGRVAPGRRRLKALVGAWSSNELGAGAPDGAGGLDADGATSGVPDLPWGSEQEQNLTDNDGDAYDDSSPAYYDYDDSDDQPHESGRKERRRKQAKEPKQRKEPGPPLWQRLGRRSKTFVARLLSAVGTGTTAWLGLSGIAYLGQPVGEAATWMATSTATAVYSETEFSFILRLVLALAIALGGFLAPSLGAGIAVLALSAGFFFTGNWLLGIIVLAGCVAWWVLSGRRSVADATVFMLTPLLAAILLAPLLPLLAGYFQNWKRAAGTAFIASILVCLLTLLTTGSSGGILGMFLGVDATNAGTVYGTLASNANFALPNCTFELLAMPSAADFRTPLITLATTPQFWLTVVSWVLAAVVCSLLSARKSRVTHVLGACAATLVLACGSLGASALTGMFAGAGVGELLGAAITSFLAISTMVSLVAALVVCLILVLFAVDTQPSDGRKVVRTKRGGR